MSHYETNLDKNDANYVPLSPLSFLERTKDIYPNYEALVYEDRKYTWSEVYKRCVKFASALEKIGIGKGENWFARKLLDFDLAANNGGWQWSASTGCDAQPYFRIFNPITQSKKFDPDGSFIRQHIPELSGFSNRRIHWPHDAKIGEQTEAKCLLGKEYPHPAVAHDIQRKRAIELFKAVKS